MHPSLAYHAASPSQVIAVSLVNWTLSKREGLACQTGSLCILNEEGASALMTAELGKEGGPQMIRLRGAGKEASGASLH